MRVQGSGNGRVLRFYKQFRPHMRQEVSASDFGGASYNNLVYAEECFDLCVKVLALQPDEVCTVERSSERFSVTELFPNEYERHFSLLTDPDAFTQYFLCTRSLRCFTRLRDCNIHRCIGPVESRRRFVGTAAKCD